MSVTIYRGDCRNILSLVIADQSVQTCVTSPPYFGLRDYGMPGQLGLEATVEEYVSNLVGVFREVRRVLKDDGTVWLNLGDSYAGSGRGGGGNAKHNPTGDTAREAAVTKRAGQSRVPSLGSQLHAGLHESARQEGAVGRAWVPPPPGLKPKDLIGIPWRVAFALQADGWYLRQDIIWHKPNPMPESVRDRCTKAHEYIFLLSKSPNYYFDADAIKEPAIYAPGKTKEVERPKGCYGGKWAQPNDGERNDGAFKAIREFRNKRSVWTVTTKPFKGAHFATFPPDLIEPCILAGSRPGDTVLDPFGGAGTTGLVAQRHGRDAVLCELNPAYIDIAQRRLA